MPAPPAMPECGHSRPNTPHSSCPNRQDSHRRRHVGPLASHLAACRGRLRQGPAAVPAGLGDKPKRQSIFRTVGDPQSVSGQVFETAAVRRRPWQDDCASCIRPADEHTAPRATHRKNARRPLHLRRSGPPSAPPPQCRCRPRGRVAVAYSMPPPTYPAGKHFAAANRARGGGTGHGRCRWHAVCGGPSPSSRSRALDRLRWRRCVVGDSDLRSAMASLCRVWSRCRSISRPNSRSGPRGHRYMLSTNAVQACRGHPRRRSTCLIRCNNDRSIRRRHWNPVPKRRDVRPGVVTVMAAPWLAPRPGTSTTATRVALVRRPALTRLRFRKVASPDTHRLSTATAPATCRAKQRKPARKARDGRSPQAGREPQPMATPAAGYPRRRSGRPKKVTVVCARRDRCAGPLARAVRRSPPVARSRELDALR